MKTNENKAIVDRLEGVLKEKGIATPDFLRAMGVSGQNYNNWKVRAVPSETIFRIADYLKLNPVWLKTGSGQKYLTTRGFVDDKDYQGVERRKPTRERVTLISWDAIDETNQSPIDWLLCPAEHSDNTFAVRFESDSMIGTGLKTYPPGTLLFVDRDAAITTGCRVIAKLPDGGITFREYIVDSGKKFLKPLNTLYSMIEIDEQTKIIGKVIGKFWSE